MENIEVYKAINAVQDDLAKIGISKDKKNIQQNYKFRGIDDVYDALAPLLAKHKLCIIPYALSRAVVERETKAGGTLFYVTVECQFDFVSAVDGSIHQAKTFGEAMDSGDKATNKAMSAAYKYAAFQTFCIPVDVIDADSTTPPEIKPQKTVSSHETKVQKNTETDIKDEVDLENEKSVLDFQNSDETEQKRTLTILSTAKKYTPKKDIDSLDQTGRLAAFRYLLTL
jgi:hypothetical protein